MAIYPRPTFRKQRLGLARRAEIAELAEAVAAEHCPTDPVDPAAVAAAKGLTLSFGSYAGAFDGMLEHRDGRFHIYANLDRLRAPETPRARFTLAHELGHYYIDEHRHALAAGRAPAHRSRCDYESPNLAEQEADHFAANLLMPTRRFVREGRRVPKGLEGVIHLARRFGASLTATALRYTACDLAVCAVIKWNRDSYAWKMLSSQAFAGRFRRTVEAPADLPEDSPTRCTLAGDVPPACGYFTAGSTGSTWFPSVRVGDARDAIFIEQAVSLGRYGVLTFLCVDATG